MKISNRGAMLALCLVSAFALGRVSTRIQIPDLVPGPGPSPIVDETPVPGDVRNILFIYDSLQRGRYPPGQRGIIDSAEFRQAMREGGWQFRYIDPVSGIEDPDSWWGRALAIDRGPLPWLVMSNGKRGYSGPWPDSVDGAKELIRKFQ